MEQRPHRCITPSTDPWRELVDCRLVEEGSTVAPPDEEVATVVVLVVVVVVAVGCPPPAPALSVVVVVVVVVGARRPSDAEVPRDLFDAATLTAFAKPCAWPLTHRTHTHIHTYTSRCVMLMILEALRYGQLISNQSKNTPFVVRTPFTACVFFWRMFSSAQDAVRSWLKMILDHFSSGKLLHIKWKCI